MVLAHIVKTVRVPNISHPSNDPQTCSPSILWLCHLWHLASEFTIPSIWRHSKGKESAECICFLNSLMTCFNSIGRHRVPPRSLGMRNVVPGQPLSSLTTLWKESKNFGEKSINTWVREETLIYPSAITSQSSLAPHFEAWLRNECYEQMRLKIT